MLPTKFQAKTRFLRWSPWQPSWISGWNNFSYFTYISHADAAHRFESNGPFGSKFETKNRFLRWWPWRPSRFPNGTILAIFDLPLTSMLPTKAQVDWPFGSAEAKIRFWTWPPAWIAIRNDFSFFFCSISHPAASYQVSSQLAFRFSRRSGK